MLIRRLTYALLLARAVAAPTTDKTSDSLTELENLIEQARSTQEDILDDRTSAAEKRGQTCTHDNLTVRRPWYVKQQFISTSRG
ncbi:hypothetical protein PC116_g30303 [Phytophthora cactorum]|nr:hypothetical protein PC116_g30303 [Phytophthora cactorum]